MSNSKERHYWSQLRAALTAGQWCSSFPAKTPNGVPLPWSELFRKFNKHCRSSQDVAELAFHTRTLGALLAMDADDEDVTGNQIYPPLDIGNECIIPSGRVQEISVNYEKLRGMQASNSLDFTLAYFAYALNKPEECLDHLGRASDILMLQNHIPTSTSERPQASAAIFVSLSDSSPPEIQDGRAWAMAETFRSICLQGMSHEKLFPSESYRALRIYHSAIPLFTTVVSKFPSPSLTQGTGSLDFTPFYQLREMWRWAERLLWRAVVLSARLCEVHANEASDATESLWEWFGHYVKCSSGWPAKFRTAHRSAVISIYLRAFVLRHRVLSQSPVYISKTPAWLHEARVLCADYRMILISSTSFPRAREHNVKVEEFADLSVAIWEAAGGAGEHAGWVIDILWWATRYTFNSPRVYRHMTRLLHLSGDTPLAVRTLKLYVQTVSKAYQASIEGVHEDLDSDSDWVQILVFGIRMICCHAAASGDPESIEDVKYAGTLIGKARSRLAQDKPLLIASLYLAEGVWNSVMALKEEDPYTRPRRLQDAHHNFILSVQTEPTSSGYFHLALSYARSGPFQDLEKAVESSCLALKADPKEIRYWHLLGLLLTAQERWKEAAEILERGAELDKEVSGELEDEDDEEGGTDSEVEAGFPIAANKYAPEATVSPRLVKDKSFLAYRMAYALGEMETTIPPASGLIRSVLEKNPPSKRDVYEYSLQLRMTQVALNEAVNGPEGAEEKWVEVFSWIAGKKELLQSSEQSHRQSLDSGAPQSTMDKTQIPLSVGNTPEIDPASHLKSTQSQLVAPITILPATPTTDNFQETRSPMEDLLSENSGQSGEKKLNGLRIKRSISIDRGDSSMSKKEKVQQMLKNRVHKGRAGITAVSRKIGHGVSKHHQLQLRRTNSTPDFHQVIRNASYQASSIHSRRRLGSFLQLSYRTPTVPPLPLPPPPPPPPPSPTSQQVLKLNSQQAKENRLLSNLWLMSAATFRRLGKIEQAKGAIQEAEAKDESNPSVWVQLGLYYLALGFRQQAIEVLQKALTINTDDIPATVHLSRICLTPPSPSKSSRQRQQLPRQSSSPFFPAQFTVSDKFLSSALKCSSNLSNSHKNVSVALDVEDPDRGVDLAAGLLSHLTQGKGWDIPEAWYFLAKAYGVQGRKEKETEALQVGLRLSEGRGVRELQSAIGWCI